ncbi:MAG: adenylosuccinate lyase [Flavobacteriales bacterium]|nr:adenylosuccinate lyase [Flavobacteriales bacterium]
MENSPLSAISPVDGRYSSKTTELGPYFSEHALIRYRTQVEVAYFKRLCQIPLPQLADVPADALERIQARMDAFSMEDALQVKKTEKTTNHDVKAVEYLLKSWMDEEGLSDYKEFVHFGLTSQDINNTSIPMSIKDAMLEVYLPKVEDILRILDGLVDEWSDVAMLARTHGQAASPTRLGKEMQVFTERIRVQLDLLKTIPYSAKFGGATGNFNAHHVAYPDVDWPAFADAFCADDLGVSRSRTTTQVEHYDNLAALMDNLSRIHVILLDLCRDMWTYVSMDYFKQRIVAGEVGSSAMPHKVNPIDFENAEGNLGIANALFGHLSAKLPISRLQRDLTDSTAMRNLGMPFAHGLIALKSIERGLGKLLLNREKLAEDLENNWAVVAEAIQTILRRENYPEPYEALKALTRTNSVMNQDSMHEFIDGLEVSDSVKSELKSIRPENYTGV